MKLIYKLLYCVRRPHKSFHFFFEISNYINQLLTLYVHKNILGIIEK